MTTLENTVIIDTHAETEQGNILDVLHAHARLGSAEWLFPLDAQADLEELHDMGMVYFVAGPIKGSLMACLTEFGKSVMDEAAR